MNKVKVECEDGDYPLVILALGQMSRFDNIPLIYLALTSTAGFQTPMR
jgi:hypothetical protein